MRAAFASLAAASLLAAIGCTWREGSAPQAPPGARTAPSPRVERPEAPASSQPEPLLAAMREELERSMSGLRRAGDPPLYYIGYAVSDTEQLRLMASFGALYTSTTARRRVLDIDLRVGSPRRDNTHRAREPYADGGLPGTGSFPLDDDRVSIRAALWKHTDAAYRNAVERFAKIQASEQTKAEVADTADDFSREPASVHHEPPARLAVSAAEWEDRLRAYSALMKRDPLLTGSSVELVAGATTRYIATSEGTSLQLPETYAYLSMRAQTRLDDGSDLFLHDSMNASSVDRLPSDDEIRRRVATLIERLGDLRRAPEAEPYVGPAILEGRAAAVFFHETLGHRLEGHRQKVESEGQTFKKKVGEAILPQFVSIYDDPRIRAFDGVELNGFYRYDDEGVAAQRADLVVDGVLKGFLLSRSPIEGFDRSNGHGRRQAGRSVVARQGNLVVESSLTVSRAELQQALLDEVRRQGKPYGLIFREITGGFTQTTRMAGQLFKAQPLMVYRVYLDGREELVRGVDFEGTPLTSLSQIAAAADDYAVFNGYCGAESGSVRVAAVSPSMLVRQIEITRKLKGQERPPLLPAPPTGATGEE